MIITEMYKGQGLGNQLWCYVTTRVIAKDKGYDFGIKSPENFKGGECFELDFGKAVVGGNGPEGGPPYDLPQGIKHYYMERKITHPINGADIRTHDENLINIPDNTKIDGVMQDEQYIIHRKREIREWLRVKKECEFNDFSGDDICVINFRGGEYAGVKAFFLPANYWENAINNMLKINKHFKFIVKTDDVVTAKKFFPNFEVFHFSICKDYVIIKNAKFLILSNSTFAWFPAWLSENLKFCIAPKYWGRHNISDGFWSCGYNITKDWVYQDREGNLQDYDSCLKELNEYIKKNRNSFLIESNFNASENYTPIRPQKKKRALLLVKKLTPQSVKKMIKESIKLLRKKPSLKNASIDIMSSKEEREVFNLLKDDFKTVFDVGVRNELSFYHMKNDCTYHLFEPNTSFVNLLKKQLASFKNHKIKLNEYGLSDKKDDNCVYYEKSQSFEINPYLKEDCDSGHRYSLRTLDDYVAKNNIPKIDFLKIDAEGFDYKIILGGLNTIKNNKVSYIQFEYWTGVKKFSDLLENNFKLYLIMEPVLLRAIMERVAPSMTPGQKQIDYTKSLIELNNDLIDLIDKKLAPLGCGGNILAINKNVENLNIGKMIFTVMPAPNNSALPSLKTRIIRKIKGGIKKNIKKITSSKQMRILTDGISEYWRKITWLSTEKIAEYRKDIKIYDVFTFLNELELLEIRLSILDKHIDYFVIIESTQTFSGLPKKLYFEENKHLFEKYKHKIIHYMIDDVPEDEYDLRNRLLNKKLSALDKEIATNALTSDNFVKSDVHWLKEFYQKESIKKALVGLSDNDFCFVSDVDEIWNPEVKIDYTRNDVFKFKQVAYVYYLNNRSNEDWAGWTGTIATKYKNIKNSCLNHLRTATKNNYTVLKNGGWHFTFQGGINQIKKKLESYGHQELNKNDIKSQIEDMVLHNKDIRGRNIKFWIDERNLPKYLLDNKIKYKKFFK